MAMSTDQIMMLAHLGDWMGSQIAPDNPFAGYAKQLAGARNFAKMLQTPGATPGAVPPATPAAPESSLAPPNPFGPEYQPPSPGTGYAFDQVPEVTPEHGGAVDSGMNDLFSRAMEPNIETKIDKDNNFVFTERRPAQQQAGMPQKKKEERPQSVTNPFWSLG